MADSGFLAQKPKSPTGLAIVITLHAVALTALALAKTPIERVAPGIIKVFKVTPEKDPPPPNPEPPPEPKAAPSVIDIVPPPLPLPPLSRNIVQPPPVPIPALPGPVIGFDPPTPPAPPTPPVRVDARIDPRSELQPPYPASERRLDREGSVTIRLLVGADGRVKSTEKVRATSDAFYATTERHALAHWRFDPASVDGRAIESWKTMTVHFRLNG
jgi:protein TonB